ncbi:hypothetical protein ACIGHF_01525 [Stenotrophomonas sp. NPDC077464]|uniref:hypothetical protein n=1 Tax=unclassified Stenotrophomonas TaxID=196198 RepID=UPI0037D96A2B
MKGPLLEPLTAFTATYRRPTLHAKVNQFAIRCFRDVGDGDYIAARLAMRSRLYSQYLTAAEQAVEKYLKCILMLNRHDTRQLSHRIDLALERVRSVLSISLNLTAVEQEVFDNLVAWDFDRYLVRSYHVKDVHLGGLDLLVWRLRQYCEPLDVVHYADEPSSTLLRQNLIAVEAKSICDPKAGHLPQGLLEKILAERRHPARSGLVWRNLRFNSANRKRTRMSSGWSFVHSPMDMSDDPRVVDEAKRWMRLR